MRKRWIPLIVVASLIIIGGSVAAILHFRPAAPIGGEPIALGKKYYISALRNSLFRYLDPVGMPSTDVDDIVRLADPNKYDEAPDDSFCIFEDNFKTFRIYFIRRTSGGSILKETELKFVITKIKRSKGDIKATVRHLYNGNINEFAISATKNHILLTSTVVYNVSVASKEQGYAPVEEVFRDSVVTMKFLRVTPTRYIHE